MLLPMMGLITLPWRSLRYSARRFIVFLRHPILSVCHPELIACPERSRREGSLSFRRRLYVARLRALRNYRLLPHWLRFISLILIPVLFLSFLSPGPEVLAVPCTCPSGNDDVRITEFTYDADGHVNQICSPEGTINYLYDVATGRHTNTWTASNNVGYKYDELGRLKTAEVKKRNGVNVSPPEVITYTYTDVGSRDSVTLPNGTKTTYQYDSLNRLKKLENRNAGNLLLSSFDYLLHSTGRRTNATEIIMGTNDTSYITNNIGWAYDGMYRLTNEVRGSTTDTYTYDLVGNRKSKTTGAANVQYYYNANDQLTNEAASASSTAYGYDANSSLTNKVITGTGAASYSYAYNVQNQMSSVTVDSVTTSYLYNHAGIRVRATGSNSKYFLTDPNNHTGYAQVLEEGTTVGSPTMSYVLGDDVIGQATSGGPSYLLYDGHGSTRQLSQPGNTVVEQYNYDAYGAAVSGVPSIPVTSMLYAGEQFDSVLKQYYLRARYYDPSNGRFNQRDPFAGNNFDPQSLHKYAYAADDPVNGLDPSGQFSLGELMTTISEVTYLAVSTMIRFAPAIRIATTTAGLAYLLSGIQLALEMYDFVPQTGYTAEIFTISGIIFSGGLAAQQIINSTQGIVSPLQGSRGRIISGRTANGANPGLNPPYKPGSVAGEGQIAPEADLVRIYKEGVTAIDSKWIMSRSEIEGLSPVEIAQKFSLPVVPTHIVDVEAIGSPARFGIAGPNFGYNGGGVQGELLPGSNAKFVHSRPL